jgi:heat shock protein HslJ
MKGSLIIFASTFVLLFACHGFAQRPITGREWVLTYLRGANAGTSGAFINIDQNGRRFTGNTGCNIMNGNVRIRGNRIAFSTVITTKRACIRATPESELLSALSRTNGFQASANRLRLYSGNRLLAEFASRRVADKEEDPQNVADSLGLDDRKWMLEAIAGTPIPMVQQDAFIVFDPAKGSAGGDTSCNVYGGKYTTNGDRISITETISTMRACIEDRRMEIERGFLDGLRTADRYEIRADRLYLYRREKLLLTFQGRKK